MEFSGCQVGNQRWGALQRSIAGGCVACPTMADCTPKMPAIAFWRGTVAGNRVPPRAPIDRRFVHPV